MSTPTAPHLASRLLTKAAPILLFAVLPCLVQAEDTFSFSGFDESQLSPAAADGLREIFSGSLFHNGMPLTVVDAVRNAVERKNAGERADVTMRRFRKAGMLPSPPSRGVPDTVVLGSSVFERDGVSISNVNCMMCHAGNVGGKVVAGLANNALVFETLILPLEEIVRPEALMLAPFFLKGHKAIEEFAALVSDSAISQPHLPDETTRGDNFGPFFVWAIGSHLVDPKHRGLETSAEKTPLVELFRSTPLPAVDGQPWWLMKYKKRSYWYSDGGPYDAAHFSANFTRPHADVNENHAAHVASVAKALAFARETQSPIYPRELDAELVQRGADLFHERIEPADTTAFRACYECHGSYSKTSDMPDYNRPGGWQVRYRGSTRLRDVGTDPDYNAVLQKFRPIADRFNEITAYYEALGTPELTPQELYAEGTGYVAPPLVGVWASAPYFHNGSVPTVEAVLNSEARPEIWSRDPDPFAYDLEAMGMRYAPMTQAEYDTSAAAAKESPKLADAHRYHYHTRSFGHSNQGHTFGDSLTTEERAAIMEFLKSLSGPDMPPAARPSQHASR